jgi:hypothetical protein
MEFIGDLLVQLGSCHQIHDLQLARREGLAEQFGWKPRQVDFGLLTGRTGAYASPVAIVEEVLATTVAALR